jgi:hypothetical protein
MLSFSLRRCLLGVVGLVAATSCVKNNYEDSGTESMWCETMDDADTDYIDQGGGSGASGVLEGRLVTDESEDIHDPNLTAYVEYTLEPPSGGIATVGETNMDGDFVENLGASDDPWILELSANKPPFTCQNTYEFVIEAGNTTHLCLDVSCTE